MKNYSEIFTHFCAFLAEIKTQFNVPMHVLRSGNIKEYMLDSFQNYMTQHEILHQFSCVDTPSQNEITGRKNRYLLETVRSLLFKTRVHKQFYANAVSTACHLSSTVFKGDIPYSILFPNKSLFLVESLVFGSICYLRNV